MVTGEYMGRGLFGMMCKVIGSLILFAAATAQSPFRPLPSDRPTTSDESARGGKARAGLPYAFGRSFRTLDEYLEHLRRRAGPMDLPWWRPIGPDRFERVTSRRMPSGRREQATRAELMRRFGFSR